MKLTLNFKELSKQNTDIAGGKGASLGEMTQAGIPVPPGFVVLSTTFETFIKEADLVAEIDAIIDNVNHKDINSVETASEKIQALIKNASMPENIAKEIEEQFKLLDTEYVAVRSSATAEDGADNAWAGQLDSYLNTKKENLLEKVQHCWASLFTPRAIFYRFEKGLHTTKISVAVVVQKMVNSEISGIAFSVHPVTEDRNQMIIEAGFGLGEAIVSGQVTPDSYVVEKEPRRIIDTNINTQTRALYRVQTGGNEWIDIPEPKASSQVLTESQVLDFADLVMRIENHYGFPCDIEWAYEGGKFYIVQSRPITTLSNKVDIQVKKKEDQVSEEIKKLKWEKWLERPFYAFILSLSEDSFSKESVKKVGIDNLFLDAMLFQNNSWFYNQEVFDSMDINIEKYLDEYGMKGITDNLEKFKIESEKKIKEIINTNYSIEDKFKEVYNILSTCMTFIWLAHGIESYYTKKLKIEVPKYVKSDVDKFIGDASFPKKKNLNTILDDSLRSDKSDEEVVEIAGWTKVRDGFSEPYTVEEIKKLREETKSSSKHEEVEIPEQLKLLFEEIKELVFFRTERTDIFYYLLFIARPIFKEIAQKHNIPFGEMKYYRAKSFLNNNPEKYGGKVSFGYYKENVIFKDTPIIEDNIITNSEVKGIVAYRGKVRGIVKIVKNTNELDKILVGDVLVTQMTFPSFISAMQKAVAFVTDEGGITCHAAIIAREMKKPCIIGTKIATQVLKDGDLVEVDADNGIVRIINNQSVLGKENKIDLLKEIYKKTKWDVQKFNAYPFYLSSTATLSGFDLPWGESYKHFLCITHNNNVSWHYDIDDYKRLGDIFWKNILSVNDLEKIRKQYNEEYIKAKINAEYSLETISNFSIKELIDLLDKQINYMKKAAGSAHIIEAATFVGEEMIKKMKIDSTDIHSTEQSFLQKALIYAEEICKVNSNIDAYNIFIEKYPWIQTSYLGKNEITLEKFLEFSKTKFEQHSYKETTDETVNIISVLFAWQDERKAHILQAIYETQGVLEIISKKLDIPLECLFFVLPEEISKLEDERYREELKKRIIAFIDYVPKNMDRIKESGEEAQKIIKELDTVQDDKINEFYGKSAYKGIIRGKVKICLSLESINSFEEGYILVASMTRPEYISAIKKSKAIITDEGGITCHAAIVSRELKIPCIIGTKIATKVLKDGDIVEVDADSGVVRIIK